MANPIAEAKAVSIAASLIGGFFIEGSRIFELMSLTSKAGT
jgi:hypothetical protein